MKYLIEDATLINIADAVRGKNGTTEPIMVSELATAITNLPSGGGDVEPLVLTGEDGYYGCVGNAGRHFAQYIKTEDLTTGRYMFYNYNGESIPFEINFKANTGVQADRMFSNAEQLISLPKVNNFCPKNMENLLTSCYSLKEIPEGWTSNWDWSVIDTPASGSANSRRNLLQYCNRLRRINDMELLAHANPTANYNYSMYYSLFQSCYCLDEVIGLPIPHTANWTSNAFSSTFGDCNHLARFTFATQEDGSPYVKPWKGQTLDLSGGSSSYAGIGFSSMLYLYGMSNDKKVSNDDTYQALKNDPDWWSATVEYARYNHDSAVETINSLPDCSATGTNTIKFRGANGSATDGGAINTLTEEEIAVATAKGWTVSLV